MDGKSIFTKTAFRMGSQKRYKLEPVFDFLRNRGVPHAVRKMWWFDELGRIFQYKDRKPALVLQRVSVH